MPPGRLEHDLLSESSSDNLRSRSCEERRGRRGERRQGKEDDYITYYMSGSRASWLAIILVFDEIIVCQANDGTDLGRDTLSDAAVRVGCLQT